MPSPSLLLPSPSARQSCQPSTSPPTARVSTPPSSTDGSPRPLPAGPLTLRTTAPRPYRPKPPSDDQSRLLKFVSQEATDAASTSNGSEAKKLYDGAAIPSKVFRSLQTEYSSPSSTCPTARNQPSMTPSPVDKPELPLGLLKLLQSDHNKPVWGQ